MSAFDEFLDDVNEAVHFQRDLSYTLGQRRTKHAYRAAIMAKDIEDLQEKMLNVKPSRVKNRTIAFVFTGQGAQHAQMATRLEKFKVFAKAIDEAEEQLRSMGATWSLKEELAKPAGESRVDAAEISWPACTAIQLALVALLKSWGVSAASVTGHSSGEIAAAFTAGMISFKTALAIVYFRGQAAARLSREQTKKGAMLALGVSPEEATKLIQEHVGGYAIVAAINGPLSVTVSGDEAAIDNVKKAASAQDIFARKLKVEMAYHLYHIEAVADFYFAAIKPFCDKDTSAKDASCPVFVSSVTARAEETTDASNWVKNLV